MCSGRRDGGICTPKSNPLFLFFLLHLSIEFYSVSAIDIFVVLSCIWVLICVFLVLQRFSFIVHVLLQSYHCHITRLS